MEYSLSLQMNSSEDNSDSSHYKPATSSLHSIRKPPAKPWRRPDNMPAPPKVYRVDPHGFRGLVQSLTGMEKSYNNSNNKSSVKERVVAPQPIKVEAMNVNEMMKENGSNLLLSPSFFSSWNSFPLLSPGTAAFLDS